MTEDLEADFLAGMGFDPLRFSPIGTRVSAGAGPATRFAALPSSPAACTARGGTWRPHRSPRCYLGPVGMRGLDGDWAQAAKQVREFMQKQVQYRKEAENPEIRRKREACQRASGTWHPVRRMCASQGRHLIWTNGTFRGLGAADEPMDTGKIATIAIGVVVVLALLSSGGER